MNIAELKKKYRLIFCTQITDRLIYWRPLTLREHDIYTKIIRLELVPIGKLQDEIFREIILDDALIDAMYQTPAGLVPSIVNTALMISGNSLLTNDDLERMNNDIKEMRGAVQNNPYEQFLILICKAFPSYTPSELEHLEYQEILRLLMMAEQIIGLEEPIELKPLKKTSLIDKVFSDRKAAESADQSRPSAVDIRDILVGKQEASLSVKQARQIEMMNRIRRKNKS